MDSVCVVSDSQSHNSQGSQMGKKTDSTFFFWGGCIHRHSDDTVWVWDEREKKTEKEKNLINLSK